MNFVTINGVKYENYLQTIPYITQGHIEELCRNHLLEFPNKQEKYEPAENLKHMPFSTIFYEFVSSKRRVPSQSEFCEYYLSNCGKELNDIFLSDALMKKGVTDRLMRAYPSYLRELHLAVTLRDNCRADVMTNPAIDVEHGIDVLVRVMNKIFGVASFTNTERGNSFKDKKGNRHKPHPGIIDYNFSIDPFKGGIKFGNTTLYTYKQMWGLLKELKNLAIQPTDDDLPPLPF